jgi:hypothetical protein
VDKVAGFHTIRRVFSGLGTICQGWRAILEKGRGRIKYIKAVAHDESKHDNSDKQTDISWQTLWINDFSGFIFLNNGGVDGDGFRGGFYAEFELEKVAATIVCYKNQMAWSQNENAPLLI